MPCRLLQGIFYYKSTQEEIRTPTPIQAPAPQAGASTNSATWVCDTNILI